MKNSTLIGILLGSVGFVCGLVLGAEANRSTDKKPNTSGSAADNLNTFSRPSTMPRDPYLTPDDVIHSK